MGLAFGGRLAGLAPINCGMISPAFSTVTMSPTCRPRRLTWSKLCSVARLTVVPASWTGSTLSDRRDRAELADLKIDREQPALGPARRRTCMRYTSAGTCWWRPVARAVPADSPSRRGRRFHSPARAAVHPIPRRTRLRRQRPGRRVRAGWLECPSVAVARKAAYEGERQAGTGRQRRSRGPEIRGGA